MTKIVKNVSIMCFHDELCQVYNALMTALSLLREGSKVTIFFGSRGINAVHKDKVKDLKCLPDQPKEEGRCGDEEDGGDGTSERRGSASSCCRRGSARFLRARLNVSLFNISKDDFDRWGEGC